MRNIKITLLSLIIPLIFTAILFFAPATIASAKSQSLIKFADAGAGAEFNQAQDQAASKVSVATAAPADTKVVIINPLGTTQDPRDIIGNVIKGVLGLVGSVALVLFIWGGIEIMLSRGDSGEIKKGQDTMIWAAIGLAVIFASYGITSYVVENISKPSV